MSVQPLLAAEAITKSYVGSRVLDGVSVAIPPERIVALIGPNGAGKTTLFDIMTGFVRADAGRVVYGGREITGRPAYWRARAGIVKTFQIPHEFGTLSVRENLLVAAPDQVGEAFPQVLWSFRRIAAEEREHERRADEILALLELTDAADLPAAMLPAGQKKLLELARALMLRPRVLMLDEPLAGVPAGLGGAILRHLTGLRDAGTTLVVVEHNLEAIMRIADRVYVLVDGVLVAAGTPREVQADEKVQAAYLGT